MAYCGVTSDELFALQKDEWIRVTIHGEDHPMAKFIEPQSRGKTFYCKFLRLGSTDDGLRFRSDMDLIDSWILLTWVDRKAIQHGFHCWLIAKIERVQ